MMGGYIDIHSHILPGVDDGAKDVDMALKMMEAAYAQGVRTMFATPHYYPGHNNCCGAELMAVYRKTEASMQERHRDFTLLPGNEIYYKEDVTDRLNDGEILTLAGTCYILLEFPFEADYKYIYNGVRKCVNAGYYPVLAHMERYHSLYKEEKKVRELIQLGAYMQTNAENFSGGLFSSERRWCLRLAQKGLMHFIGSDCHNMQTRCPNLKQAVDYLSEKLEEGTFRRIIYDNPAKLLAGEYLK